MRITENIPSYWHNVKNDTYIDRCYWCILGERNWPKQEANLYENPLKISNRLRKASLQYTKETIRIEVSKKALK